MTKKTHCKRGHKFSEENTYVSKAGARHCRACRTLTRPLYKESSLEDKRRWRKEWRKRNPHYHRDREREKKLGVTPEQTAEMLVKQENKCAICEEIMSKPCLDHNHKTLQVRELLCGNCNLGIGYLKDTPLVVEKALYYLLKHEEIRYA